MEWPQLATPAPRYKQMGPGMQSSHTCQEVLAPTMSHHPSPPSLICVFLLNSGSCYAFQKTDKKQAEN